MLSLRWLAVGFCAAVYCGASQTTSVQLYTLLSGSQLTDDCPICDRIPIVLPLNGTFGLKLQSQTPISRTYELMNIALLAGTTSGPQYQVQGGGVYQVGGEVAVSQQMYLNATVSNGLTGTSALCVSTSGPVTQPWPRIQIQVDQTNGSPAKVYHFALTAAPVPRFRSISTDAQTGDILLQWDSIGVMVQLERALDIFGPYSALTPVTTNSSFTDSGAVVKFSRAFYRLRLF